MSPWKLLTMFWLPASIGVTALALANIAHGIDPAMVAWTPLFAKALEAYGATSQGLFAPAGQAMHQFAGFGMPAWASDSLVAYVASASGFSAVGSNFTTREGSMHTLRSSAASAGWPLALAMFAVNAVRNRAFSRFARDHTLLFVLYVVAVGAVLGVGAFGTGFFERLGL